ncbi:lysophospholipid acyltransferase family protein [Flavimaricola marinus]|uniref:Lipid A biosynthesis lauroyl acyltransferase n=1 Tax=Flavimaricola marinus TaxID=1819565 RepID=A0A238LH98_9RHOB|nr:lysophospholipid acyltransferase family protein [Flavimaricola marinus]SMY09069.1 Lipid A biosynthesis lauroyl acyltransferase [Flavimaricola marinus]
MAKPREKGTATDWLSDKAIKALLAIAMARPYEKRIPLMAQMAQRIVAPLAGFNRRVRSGLAHVRPDLSEAEIQSICREVADNFGRTVAEIYSGQEFVRRVAASNALTGPGLAVLKDTQAQGKPVILAVAHFGNYDAMRAALVAEGLTVGAVYRPMDNPYFNAHYADAIHKIAEPLFPRDRAGTVGLVRFIRSGGMVALGFDQYSHQGADLTFFGKSAPTILSPAEFALKYDAPLIPIHAIRQSDGLSFQVLVDAPIPPGRPEEMMQAANDRLEQIVRAHMGQWFWVHRRWKPDLPRKSTADAPPPE